MIPTDSSYGPSADAVPDADARLLQFDQAWQGEAPPLIADFLPADLPLQHPARLSLLAELLKIDLEYRWRSGTRLLVNDNPGELAGPRRPLAAGPCLDEYLRCFPELGPPEQVEVELIGEEYWARHCWGDQPGHDEYLDRFSPQRERVLKTLCRIDADLALERSAKSLKTIRTPAAPPAVLEPEAAVLVLPVAQVLEMLRHTQLLTSQQFEELTAATGAHTSDAPALAKELLRRGWLTSYQAEQVLRGRGAGLVLGPHVILERLGEGGIGQVFKARHRTLQRIVAIKLIREDLLADADVVNRFYREIQLISQFTHPHVVHAYDAGPVGAAHVLVMEYVEGITLDRLVKESGPLPVAQACEYIRQAALGLQHAHERGLVHRDLKPSNLLLSGGRGRENSVSNGGGAFSSAPDSRPRTLNVKILDLGLARLHQKTDGDLTSTMTPSGPVTMGTPDYMAPEQALDFHGVDTRADIYSLGCTLHYLLTGQAPFCGGTLAQKLLRHQQAEPPAVAQVRSDVPPPVLAVLRKMLAKEPARRFQTPGDVAGALAALSGLSHGPAALLCDGRSSRPSESLTVEALPRPQSPRTRILRARIGILVLLLGAMILWFLLSARNSGERQAAPIHAARERFAWLNELDPAKIAPAQRSAWQPKELVAVLGDKRGRPWGNVHAIAFGLGGKVVVSGGANALHLWDPTTLQERATLFNGYRGSVHALAVSPDGKRALAGYSDGHVRAWDLVACKEQATFNASHTGNVTAVAYGRDGKTAASGGNKTVKLWDAVTANERATLAAHDGLVLALAFAGDGLTLASGSDDGTAKLWDAATGRPKGTLALPEPKQPVAALAFSPDGKLLAVGRNDGGILLWDTNSSKVRSTLQGHAGGVTSLAFSPDSTTLASGSIDRTIKLWDVATATVRIALQRHADRVNCLAYSPDGRLLASASGNRQPPFQGAEVRLWDAATGRKLVLDLDEGIRNLALAPDGSGVATCGNDGTLRFWDAATLTPRILQGHSTPVRCLVFTPNGQALAYATDDPTVRLLDLPTGQERATFQGPQRSTSGLAISADGATLAAASERDSAVILWDVATRKSIGTLKKDRANFHAVAISPDGKTVAAASSADVTLWNVDTQDERCIFKGSVAWGRVLDLAFSPNGKLLATASYAGTVKLWDVAQQKERLTLPVRHAGGAHSVAFSPDGQLLATCGADGRILVWDVAAGKLRQEVELPGWVGRLAFFGDGRHLATVNGNGTVYILRLLPTDQRAAGAD